MSSIEGSHVEFLGTGPDRTAADDQNQRSVGIVLQQINEFSAIRDGHRIFAKCEPMQARSERAARHIAMQHRSAIAPIHRPIENAGRKVDERHRGQRMPSLHPFDSAMRSASENCKMMTPKRKMRLQ
jgi:hypothetical protein